MKIEEQVTNLELSKKLKELGVKQESLYYWGKAGMLGWQINNANYARSRWSIFHIISAFTVAELGKLLPDTIEVNNTHWTLTIEKSFTGSWDVRYGNEVRVSGKADTEADTRAKMLIYLIEHGEIKM